MAARGERPSVSDEAAVSLRDLMSHRGPDGGGLWRKGHVLLAHRRLAVIDRSHAGDQPMWLDAHGLAHSGQPPRTGVGNGELRNGGGGSGWRSAERDLNEQPRFVLVYNGELYNDGELRQELTRRGAQFRTSCDTETVLHAWAAWGTRALDRFRGMFALAVYDASLDTLTLARDALGVKPLYYWLGPRELVFASEPGPILGHPGVVRAPNMAMVSAYLTTIRTVLGPHTLFQGVHALEPGHLLQCDLGSRGDGVLANRLVQWWRGPTTGASGAEDLDDAARRVRAALADSVRVHLRADVPVCALLSGGLDSSAIAAEAKALHPGLKTFCASAPANIADEADALTDLSMAREVAQVLATQHQEAIVTREGFQRRWRWMVGSMGVPLSTPNEVAIFEVARRLRDDGCVVTLSGEGADELFAGYDQPLDRAMEFRARFMGKPTPADSAAFELRAQAWMPPDFKHGILSERAWEAALEDQGLETWYADEFAAAAHECGDDGLAAHLRMHRRVNLTGLLQRLDSATMLASVEGRTPFADRVVAELAESLAMDLKFEAADEEADASGARPGAALATLRRTMRRTRGRTKVALREAYAGVLPQAVLSRPKASFPLPFQEWMEEPSRVLRRSAFAHEIFNPAAIEAVSARPGALWSMAWPMINVALWAEAMGW